MIEPSTRTLTKFPFRLPKSLAPYMRMGAILEGIYQRHSVRFHFVRVPANLLEKEGLIKEADFDELEHYAKRLAKGIESYINLAPILRSDMKHRQIEQLELKKSRTYLTLTIFASALFVGSANVTGYIAYSGFGGIIVSVGAFCGTITKMLKIS